MKRFVLVLAIIGFCGVFSAVPAHAMQPNEFNGALQDFRAGDISPEDFIVTCEYVLARHSANNTAYRIRAYSALWEATVLTGNPDNARQVAQRAINEWPQSPFGYQLMSDIYAMEVDVLNTEKYLRLAAERTTGAQDRKALLDRANAVGAYINSFMPIWTDFAENPDEAQRMYTGSKVLIQGVITDIVINADPEGRSLLFFAPDQGSATGVYCTFDKASETMVSELKQGQAVQIQGTCLGFIQGNVVIRDAVAEQI